jgi:hypothetical protein
MTGKKFALIMGGLIGAVVVIVAINQVNNSFTYDPDTVGPAQQKVLNEGFNKKIERERAAKKALAAGRAEWLKTTTGKRFTELQRAHSDWTTDECESIASHQVDIGMTKAMCREALGAPKDINYTTTAAGTSEQWCYGEFCKPAVYFAGDVVTAVQH